MLTIGYEGKSLDAYLTQLAGAGVSLLCDVRANPFSRKRGFSKRALAEACAAAGIRYEHLPELGIPSAERRDIGTPEQRDALFARYTRDVLPRQGAALARIREWIEREGQRVALTCYELDARECHRSCVARALEAAGVGAAENL